MIPPPIFLPVCWPWPKATRLYDQDIVELTAEGEMCELVIEFFRIAFGNLKCPGVDKKDDFVQEIVEKIIYDKIDAYFGTLDEPAFKKMLNLTEAKSLPKQEEYCEMSKTNDKFHSYTAPMFPFVARHFACNVEFRFQGPDEIIRVIKMDPNNMEKSIDDVLSIKTPAGTKISIAAVGSNRVTAVKTIRAMLSHLKECDEWLRNRQISVEDENSVVNLVEFAQSLAEVKGKLSDTTIKYRIGDILTEDRILVFAEQMPFTKEEALRQMVHPHSAHHSLSYQSLIDAVKQKEREFPIILDKGVAISHATLVKGPRVSLTVGVFPKGVKWSDKGEMVQIVFFFVTAPDTHGTYRMYLGQLAKILRGDRTLRLKLIHARNSRDVLSYLFYVEEKSVHAW